MLYFLNRLVKFSYFQHLKQNFINTKSNFSSFINIGLCFNIVHYKNKLVYSLIIIVEMKRCYYEILEVDKKATAG